MELKLVMVLMAVDSKQDVVYKDNDFVVVARIWSDITFCSLWCCFFNLKKSATLILFDWQHGVKFSFPRLGLVVASFQCCQF